MNQTEVPSSALATSALAPTRVIGGFGRRLLAFVIDAAVLAGIGATLGFFAFDLLTQWGGAAKIVGIVIATVYFGTLNSSIGRGRTLGKQLVGLEVVACDGTHLGWVRSIIRSSVIVIPFIVGGWLWRTSVIFNFAGFWICLVEVVLPLAVVYLLSFNRQTRQSVHDLITRSYVVARNSTGPVSAPKIWRGHFVVIALGVVVSAIPFLQAAREIRPPARLENSNEQKALRAALEDIGRTGANHECGIGEDLPKAEGAPIGSKQTMSAFARYESWPKNPEATATAVAAILLRRLPKAAAADAIDVTIEVSYDIGIWRSRRRERFVHTPDEWKALIASARP